MHPSCQRNNTTISSSCSILYLPIFIIYIALNPFFFSKNIINEKENMTNFMILKKIFQLQTFLVDFPTGTTFSLLLTETIRIQIKRTESRAVYKMNSLADPRRFKSPCQIQDGGG